MSRDADRALVLGAVRSQLRAMQIDPVMTTASDAHVVLDELARQFPDLVVSQWYRAASSYQLRLFYVEWANWCVEQREQLRVSHHFQNMMNRLLPLE